MKKYKLRLTCILVSVIYLFSIPFLGMVEFDHFNGKELVRLYLHVMGAMSIIGSIGYFIKSRMFLLPSNNGWN